MPYGIRTGPDQRTINGFFCGGCNSILISFTVHDYKTCECGNMVDGGSDYVRRGYKDEEAFRKVVEIYDLGAILVLAEHGAAAFYNFDEDGYPMDTAEVLGELVKQERLVAVGDAEFPDDGDGIVSVEEGFTEEELALAAEEKDRKDRAAADEMFGNVSLVDPDAPTLP